jgi:hypothetical protein
MGCFRKKKDKKTTTKTRRDSGRGKLKERQRMWERKEAGTGGEEGRRKEWPIKAVVGGGWSGDTVARESPRDASAPAAGEAGGGRGGEGTAGKRLVSGQLPPPLPLRLCPEIRAAAADATSGPGFNISREFPKQFVSDSRWVRTCGGAGLRNLQVLSMHTNSTAHQHLAV